MRFVPCCLLLAVALAPLAAHAAPPPPASQAKALVASRSWDDLYLAFSAPAPSAYSEADRRAIADALEHGARALIDADPVMGVSLAERAVVFHETAPGLVLAAQLNQRVKQNGQAARQLDRAIAVDPKDPQPRLLRAELALDENDAQLALSHLDALPRKFEPKRVLADRARAKELVGKKQAGRAALAQLQRDLTQHQDDAAHPVPAPVAKNPPHRGKVITIERAPADPLDGATMAGLRERAGEHFSFAYGNNQRDWGQRAEYEGKVMATLEEAYRFVGETLRANRTQPVGVVLYTKEEYDFHFGGSALGRAAGFFTNKIRINGAEEMTPEVHALIVHEYVHAVVAELTQGHHVPQWVNEGLATYVENEYRSSHGLPGADDAWRQPLRALAGANKLPPVSQLDTGFLNLSNPRLGYATAGMGVRLLVEHHGMDTFVQALRDSATTPFAQLLVDRYSDHPGELDGQIREALMQ